MPNSHVSVLVAALGFAAVSFATPAAALKWEGAGGAKELCAKRAEKGECNSYGIKGGVVACVNNQSTGNGVSCVQCKTGKNCTILREVPGKGKWEAIRGNVSGVMSNSPGKATRPSTKDISITKALDSASASLARKAGEKPLEYMKIELKDATISGVQKSGSPQPPRGNLGARPPTAGLLGGGGSTPSGHGAAAGRTGTKTIKQEVAPMPAAGPTMQSR